MENKFYFLKFLKNNRSKYLDRLIKTIYSIEKRLNNKTVKVVMNYKPVSTENVYGTERAFPSDEKFIKNGWYKQMLKRYLFSGRYFCKNKLVLDSCCGTGWGAFIVSSYAKQIDAFDISKEQIEENVEYWSKYTNKINWIINDALKIKTERKYDIVLAIESLEHFSKEDGEMYVKRLSDCVSGGGLVGTTPILETAEAAMRNMKDNPYHLHIYKEKELYDLLFEYFDDVVVHKHKGLGFFFAIKNKS